jgi:hypothetical protein
MYFSKWRPEIFHEIEYLDFHNYNIFYWENMENVRYATNDDTAGFINQMKNRNTSRKTEYDLKVIKNYFTSLYT